MKRRERFIGEAGQAAPMLFICLLAGIAFLGLAVDGARLFLARRNIHNAVDAATLAGASELDEESFRSGDGTAAQLDPTAAEAAATEALVDSGLPSDAVAEIHADPLRIEVTVRREVPMIFLRVIGMDTQKVGADARSSPKTR